MASLALASEREALFARFSAEPSGREWCRLHSDAVDAWVREAHRLSEVGDGLAVVATGGYGRREMSPYSDVDLTVVPSNDAADDEAVRRLYRALHAALTDERGYEFGYSLRLVADAPGLDAKTQAGLLDARLVVGPAAPLEALLESFEASFLPADFLLAKIAEREAACARNGRTPYVAEPHLKDGAGGLRSFHAANWIGYALGERVRKPDEAVEVLLRVRNALHLVTGRKADLLTRPRQADVAVRLGTSPDALMTEVGPAMVRLDDEYEHARGRIRRSEFRLSGGAAAIDGEARPDPGAEASEAAVGLAMAAPLRLETARRVGSFSPPLSGSAVLNAFARGERALRDFDRCGLLGYFLPELEAVRYLVPGDPAHALTVFAHSLRVVAILDALNDPLLNDLQEGLRDRGILVIAALLHDVGKVDPDRSHTAYGAELAETACARLRLSPTAAADVVWLVREHQTMVSFMRLRDVSDPATVAEFAGVVVNQERLSMLTLLSYADVAAVGEETWTPSHDAFLRELFRRTSEALAGGTTELEPSVVRRRLRRVASAVPPERLEAFLDSLPAHYLVSTDPGLVPVHLSMVERAAEGEVAVGTESRPELAATEVTVAALDRPRLLESILAVVYAHDLSVSGLRVATAAGAPPIALDVLHVASHRAMLSSGAADRLADDLERVLSGAKDPETLLRERGKDPERGPGILWHRFVPGARPVLEVRAPRGRGVPYRLAKWIAGEGWAVTSARLGQWGPNVAAAFYLDPNVAADEIERAISSLP